MATDADVVGSGLEDRGMGSPQTLVAGRRAVTPATVSRRREGGPGHEQGLRCQERLAECQARLRAARHEFDMQRGWLEARALRLDGVIGDIDLFLEAFQDSSTIPRRRTRGRFPIAPARSRNEMILSSAKAVQRGDGCWDIQLDSLAPCRLPPLLGRLFALLAEDTGRELGDGVVGFKSNAYLLAKLRGPFAGIDPKSAAVSGRLNARGLAQAVYELRGKLAKAALFGDALVQTRRGVGRRVAVRKPTPPGRR